MSGYAPLVPLQRAASTRAALQRLALCAPGISLVRAIHTRALSWSTGAGVNSSPRGWSRSCGIKTRLPRQRSPSSSALASRRCSLGAASAPRWSHPDVRQLRSAQHETVRPRTILAERDFAMASIELDASSRAVEAKRIRADLRSATAYYLRTVVANQECAGDRRDARVSGAVSAVRQSTNPRPSRATFAGSSTTSNPEPLLSSIPRSEEIRQVNRPSRSIE